MPGATRGDLDRFRRYLKDHRLSWTKPRRTIAELALRAKRHFTAQELLAWTHQRDASVGKVTVYRTLHQLVASGLLARRDFVRDRMHFEPIRDRPHHEHMICLSCDRILEFIHEEIERIQDEVARRHGFRIVSHVHKLFGYCDRCAGGSRAAASRRPPRSPAPSGNTGAAAGRRFGGRTGAGRPRPRRSRPSRPAGRG